MSDVRAANEDSLLELADHLPGEAAEALLDIAAGSKPKATPASIAPMAGAAANPFEHPDALRRFRAMTNIDELARALDFP